MNILLYFSDLCIPFVIFAVIMTGMIKKQPVYDQFVEGAKEGLNTVVSILPTLVGLYMSVSVLRASGFLDLLSDLLSPIAGMVGYPAELVPLTLVKLFSSSASTGLLLDIYENYGPDSVLGRIASIQLSCTETLFYTVSVYFLATATKEHAPVLKSRYTVPGALFATLAGVVMSVILAKFM